MRLRNVGFERLKLHEGIQGIWKVLEEHTSLLGVVACALVAVGGTGLVLSAAHFDRGVSSAAVASASGALSGAPAAPSSVITGQGAVVPLHDLVVSAPLSAVLIEIKAKGAAVERGDVIARFDATTAQEAVRTAEAAYAAAVTALEAASRPIDAPPASLPDIDTLYGEMLSRGSEALQEMPRLLEGNKAVLFGFDASVARTQENVYAYFDMIKAPFPDVLAYRDAALREYAAADAAIQKSVASFAGAKEASQRERRVIIADIVAADAALRQSLSSTQVFLKFVEEGLVNRLQEVPAHLVRNRARITDHQSVAEAHGARLASAYATIATAENTPAPQATAPDAAAIANAEGVVRAREIAHAEAREAVSAYVVRSPVNGEIQKSARLGYVVEGAELLVIMSPELVVRAVVDETVLDGISVGARVRIVEVESGVVGEGTVARVSKNPRDPSVVIVMEGASFPLGTAVEVSIVTNP